MNRLASIIKFIWTHPLASKNRLTAFGNFIKWQVSQTAFPHTVIMPFIENSKLVLKKGMEGGTGNIYTGLVEFEEMAFILHVLRSKDIFADVGANIGAYTILASKNAGATSYSFEPVSETFKSLQRNINANSISFLVHAMPYGVGAKKEALFFTQKFSSANHAIAEKNHASINSEMEVSMITLDEIFEDQQPQVMKIDVEGFEWNVLEGAGNTLRSESLKAIIIELNGCGMRYGFTDESIHHKLVENFFHPYNYKPYKRELTSLKTFGRFNTIYIRDFDWVNKRIQSAPKFKIFKQEI